MIAFAKRKLKVG